MQLEDKLAILADSAKYDVACTSSGVDRAGVHGKLGCSVAAGICLLLATQAWAQGSTTRAMVCDLVAPSAREASR